MPRLSPGAATLIAILFACLLLVYIFGPAAILRASLWVAVGAVIGWFGSLAMRTDTQSGILLDIGTGASGAFAGLLLFGGPALDGSRLEMFLASVLGSLLLLALAALVRRLSRSKIGRA